MVETRRSRAGSTLSKIGLISVASAGRRGGVEHHRRQRARQPRPMWPRVLEEAVERGHPVILREPMRSGTIPEAVRMRRCASATRRARSCRDRRAVGVQPRSSRIRCADA